MSAIAEAFLEAQGVEHPQLLFGHAHTHIDALIAQLTYALGSLLYGDMLLTSHLGDMIEENGNLRLCAGREDDEP